MNTQWLAMEHYRLHVIEQWSESSRKEAALRAVRSTIRSLTARGETAMVCAICDGRSRSGQVVEFPSRPLRPNEQAA